MPIAIDDFNSGSEELLSLEEGSQAFQVLKFLSENPDKAFKPKEIEEETGIGSGSLGAVLSRLEESGVVRHKGSYWAIAEDDRIAAFTAEAEASSSSVTDNYFGGNK